MCLFHKHTCFEFLILLKWNVHQKCKIGAFLRRIRVVIGSPSRSPRNTGRTRWFRVSRERRALFTFPFPVPHSPGSPRENTPLRMPNFRKYWWKLINFTSLTKIIFFNSVKFFIFGNFSRWPLTVLRPFVPFCHFAPEKIDQNFQKFN